jgi:hypothetical protein
MIRTVLVGPGPPAEIDVLRRSLRRATPPPRRVRLPVTRRPVVSPHSRPPGTPEPGRIARCRTGQNKRQPDVSRSGSRREDACSSWWASVPHFCRFGGRQSLAAGHGWWRCLERWPSLVLSPSLLEASATGQPSWVLSTSSSLWPAGRRLPSSAESGTGQWRTSLSSPLAEGRPARRTNLPVGAHPWER